MKPFCKSSRRLEGQRWRLSPQDQTLSYSMVKWVDKNIGHLEKIRTGESVCEILLEYQHGHDGCGCVSALSYLTW